MSTSTWLSFERSPEAANALVKWWEGLEASRGDRADLRRCRSAADVAFCEAFHRLRVALKPYGRQRAESLALAAGVLSHVRSNVSDTSFGTQIAAPKEGAEKPRLSGLRFRRLLRLDGADELYGEWVRVVRLLGGIANVVSLAETIMNWNKYVKKQLAYTYYEKAADAQ